MDAEQMLDEYLAQQIKDVRAQIDALDEQIVDLLNARAELVLELQAIKPQAHLGLYSPAREAAIMEHIASCNAGPLYNDHLKRIYEAIWQVSKEIPRQ